MPDLAFLRSSQYVFINVFLVQRLLLLFPLLNLTPTPTLNADCLELALQFGMIMMFASAFPLAFAFAALVNSFLISLFLVCFTNTVYFLLT